MHILTLTLDDTQQSWAMTETGSYRPCWAADDDGYSVHEELMKTAIERNPPAGWQPH